MALPPRLQWKKQLEALTIFRSVHGHCRVPLDYIVPATAPWPASLQGASLGKMAVSIRSGSKAYTPGRFEVLEAIGFAWSLFPDVYYVVMAVGSHRRVQTTRLPLLVSALRAYHKLYGTLDIPDSFVVPADDARWPVRAGHVLLASAMQTLRCHFYELSDGNVLALRHMGLWPELPPWSDALLLLSLHKIHVGSMVVPIECVVPASSDWPSSYHGLALGKLAWYLGIKSTLLPPDKRSQLVDLQLDWNAPATWATVVDGLRVYHRLHASTVVPLDFVAPDEWPESLRGLHLGCFAAQLQAASALKLLPPATQCAVDELVTSDAAKLWGVLVDALAIFRTVHGHMVVPDAFCVPPTPSIWPIATRGLQLGAAVAALRAAPSIDTHHRATLHALGFAWATPLSHETGSDASANNLERVHPPTVPDEPAASTLSVEAPSAVETSRRCRRWSWAAKIEALSLYRKVHGHLEVPADYCVPEEDYPRHLHGMALGKAVIKLRIQTIPLAPDRIEDLNMIGFLWRTTKSTYTRCMVKTHGELKVRPVSLFAQIQALVTFREIHGHLSVPESFVVPSNDAWWPSKSRHIVLAHVLPALRLQLYELSDTETAWVVSAGLITDIPPFNDFVRLVQIYRTEVRATSVARDFIVPATGGSWPATWRGLALGDLAWRVGLKARALDVTRRAALIESGFIFNSPATWARIVSGLRTFHSIHGVTKVPLSFVVPNEAAWPQTLHGMTLGHWVKTMKGARKNHLLPPKTLADIDAITDPQPSVQSVPPPKMPASPSLPADVADRLRLLAICQSILPPAWESTLCGALSFACPDPLRTRPLGACLLEMEVGTIFCQWQLRFAAAGFDAKARWRAKLEALSRFQAVHGHWNVPETTIVVQGLRLADIVAWLQQLTPARVAESVVAQLDALNFEWHAKVGSYVDQDAEEVALKDEGAGDVDDAATAECASVASLDETIDRADVCSRPEPARITLAVRPQTDLWAVDPHSVVCLETATEWSSFISALRAFRDRFGHAHVPFDYVTSDLLALGHLVQQLQNGHVEVFGARTSALDALQLKF